MSDLENVDLEVVENEVTVEENEYSPAEEKAMSSGWRPEEEWSGDSDDWVDAKTFNRNGEFMSRIQNQTKELSTNRSEIEALKSGMRELGEHNKKIAEQEYKKALKSLKQEKVLALEEEDHSAVVEIEDKIDELKEVKRDMDKSPSEELHKEAQDVAPSPAFVAWAESNQWYKKDVSLRGAADAIGMDYSDSHPQAPIEEVLEYVNKTIKAEFPNKFNNAKASEPSTVTEKSTTVRRGVKNKYTEKDLSTDQLEFAKMFVSTGAFENIQEYVESLAASGDL